MNKNLWQKAIFVCSLIVALISISFSVSAASASIKLNKTSASLYAGGIVQLKATVKGSSSTVKWSTSNKSVATVTTKGKVTAKKAGTATITAKCGKLSAKCKITVKTIDKKKIAAAYKKALSDLSWPTAVFAVTDINKDGVYEVIVEDIVYNDPTFHPERKGYIFYYYKNKLKKFSYGPTYETFESINSKKQIVMGRTKGKAITSIYSFAPSKGVKVVTSFFTPYLSEAEADKMLKKYYSGLSYPIFKKVTATNLKTYLSGSGKSTGSSTKWVSKGLSNI